MTRGQPIPLFAFVSFSRVNHIAKAVFGRRKPERRKMPQAAAREVTQVSASISGLIEPRASAACASAGPAHPSANHLNASFLGLTHLKTPSEKALMVQM